METVVLIHGLWFSGWSMSLLRHRLLRAGYRVKVFSYPTVSVDLDANARALARFATGQQGDRLHFVAHSLGGLVLRRSAAGAWSQLRGRGALWSVTAPAPGVAYAVGEAGLILAWDGQAWAPRPLADSERPEDNQFIPREGAGRADG